MPFTPLVQRGYFVEYAPEESGEYRHYFCGEHHVPGAWCPNCDKPLLRYMTIDPQDPRLQLSHLPVDLIHLFFCWTCNVSSENFSYQVQHDGGIELVEYGLGLFEEGSPNAIPYDDFPLFFPGTRVKLTPVSAEEQAFIKGYNEYGGDPCHPDRERWIAEIVKHEDRYMMKHQIGGEPLLLVLTWDAWEMNCPRCGREMPYLASFDDANLDPRGFTDGYIHIAYTFCPDCLIVGTAAFTD